MNNITSRSLSFRTILTALAFLLFPAGFLLAQYYPNMDYGPAEKVAPGVTWQTATHSNPAWSIQIIEVDMTHRNMEVLPVFKSAGNVSGSPNETTSSMAERVNAVAAVNAGYFTTDGTRLTNSYTLIDGQFIGGSGTDMMPENNRSALGFSGAGQAIPKRTKLNNDFVPSDPENWDQITDAIAGRGHFVTSNGTLVTQDNESTTSSHHAVRHPRTAMGYSLDPYRVWLVTVDGRQDHSVGMTYLELGRLMADLGVEESVSLDGGGSTTAWIAGEGVVNSLSDGWERGVVSAWAVVPATTIDNTSEEAIVTGNWSTDQHNPEQYHLDHLITTTMREPSSITWRPELDRPGFYEVYAWWASHPQAAPEATYSINHHFATSTETVDQRDGGGQWNLIGTLPFNAGTDGSVTLDNNLDTEEFFLLSGDAVRFVLVEENARMFWTPKDWQRLASDDFGDHDAPIEYDPLVKDPPDGTGGNSVWERNFDYTQLAGPSLPVPDGGNGAALRAAANNLEPPAAQILYQTFGSDGLADSAAEALLLGYLADDNTGGATTWGGIGVRMSDDFQNGYFVQHRVDSSSAFGNYVNFYRLRDGETTLLGRYYYEIGSGGIQQGTLGDSRPIRSPQEAATNQWVPIRLEAVGSEIALFIENPDSPVTVFFDSDPIETGKAMLFHEDPFDSLTEPPNSSGTFFESFQVDVPAEPGPDKRPIIESLEPLEGGGVRVQLSVEPNREYIVEASSDLDEWIELPDVFTADSDGKLLVDDPEADERRYWRLKKTGDN